MRTHRMSPATGVVKKVRGNVLFCRFGAEADHAECPADGLPEVLAAIRDVVAEINKTTAEVLTTNAAASAAEKDVSRLLMRALDSVDNVAFQSNILAAGATPGSEAELVTANLLRFVHAGAAVNQQLRSLVNERRHWLDSEARVLEGILERAAELEATACACIQAHTDVQALETSN